MRFSSPQIYALGGDAAPASHAPPSSLLPPPFDQLLFQNSYVPLGQSPRRLPRGHAWFFLNKVSPLPCILILSCLALPRLIFFCFFCPNGMSARRRFPISSSRAPTELRSPLAFLTWAARNSQGFLCDGREFEDDSLDPVPPGEPITCAMDMPNNRFTVNPPALIHLQILDPLAISITCSVDVEKIFSMRHSNPSSWPFRHVAVPARCAHLIMLKTSVKIDHLFYHR